MKKSSLRHARFLIPLFIIASYSFSFSQSIFESLPSLICLDRTEWYRDRVENLIIDPNVPADILDKKVFYLPIREADYKASGGLNIKFLVTQYNAWFTERPPRFLPRFEALKPGTKLDYEHLAELGYKYRLLVFIYFYNEYVENFILIEDITSGKIYHDQKKWVSLAASMGKLKKAVNALKK